RRLQPAEARLRHVLRAPERDVARPEAGASLLLLRRLQPRRGVFLALAEALAQLCLAGEALRRRARRDGVQEAVQSLGEEVQALVGEIAADLLQIDAERAEPCQLRARLVDAFD